MEEEKAKRDLTYTDFIIHSLEEISLKEQLVIFYSVAKWTIIATIIGTVAGAGVYLFLALMDRTIEAVSSYKYYFFLLPLALYVNYLISLMAPDTAGDGTDKIINRIHQHNGDIKWYIVPVTYISTIVTVAFGGSVGKEGPGAQIGGGLASILAKVFRVKPHEMKKFVICGISAGFAAVFGTPIAGSIFGVEALFVGSMLYDVLLPAFVAGITAYQVATFLGVKYFYYNLNFIPMFSESFFIKVILAGVFFGICSFLFIEIHKFFEKIAENIKPVKRPFVGGLAIIILALVFSTKYLGLGLDTIESSLQGNMNMWYDFILKIVFTGITLSFFGSGGAVTPMFFIGATSGTVFADLLNLNRETFAALGVVALLSGAANTPIAASIMAIEIFGKDIAPYACLASVVSFLITGYRSLYPSQIISSDKCELVKSAIGKQIVKVHPEVHDDEVQKTLLGDTQNLAQNLKDRLVFLEDLLHIPKRKKKKK